MRSLSGVLLCAIIFFFLSGVGNVTENEGMEELNRKLVELYKAGQYKEAISIAEKLLSLREKQLGAEHPDIATSLNNLAMLYNAIGDYKRAKPLYERALKIREKALGMEHPDTATSLNNLAGFFYAIGDYKRAKPLYERALKIREKVLGAKHRDTAASLNNLAMLHVATGDHKRAESLYERALKIKEEVLGPEHRDTATSLNNLAMLYVAIGDYKRAEPLCKRALKIREKVLGSEHPDTATSLNNLAMLYVAIGDYGRAEPLYDRSMRICEKAFGAAHPVIATCLNNLAELYETIGDYRCAETLYERALKICEKALGEEHPNTATSLNNLAGIYKAIGDYRRAEPLYERALKIKEKILGPEHPDTATSLNNLAMLYLAIGDYRLAEPLCLRALKIYEKAFGLEHPRTAVDLNNLAMLYYETGDYKRAEPLYGRALKIFERLLGPEHTDTATSLDNMAGNYKAMGDYDQAEPLYERALKIKEKALGPEHPDTAVTLNNLAVLYAAIGDYKREEPLLERTLKTCEKVLGPEHPDTAVCLENLSFLQLDKGNTASALEKARNYERAEEKTLANVLSFTSERQRLLYQKTTDPYSLICTLGCAPDIAKAVLRNKGVVLDSLIEDMRIAAATKAPEQVALVEKLRSSKERLTKLLIETPKDMSEEGLKRVREERERLEREVEEMEGALGRYVSDLGRPRRSLSIRVSDVQAVLPSDAALVEYIRYSHYLGKNKFEKRYGAVVIMPGGDPGWVPLGKAQDIEALIQKLQKLFGVKSGVMVSKRGLKRAESAVSQGEDVTSRTLRGLCIELWEPIETSFPEGVKTMILCPDGNLNFVPFAALLRSDDRFCGERYNIRYVSSGRDLLEKGKTGKNSGIVMFGNPDFGAILKGDKKAGSRVRGASSDLSDDEITSLNFTSLPGTAKECGELESLAESRRYPAESWLGENASESKLRDVHTPWILHMATHGFFLPSMEKEADGGPEGSRETGSFFESRDERAVNPMLRSGLALSGANVTLEAWKRNETPDIENDGIVCAKEVGALDLDGTWLVVLSACETALGESRAGEGILGLRRGFVQAGVRNLMMTLWSISDEASVRFMKEYYRRAWDSKDASKSLCEVQRDLLVELRKEKGIWEAVYCAGPFVLTSQGRP